MATIAALALVLLRFLSGSLLAWMGDACGGIFAAGHGFLAESSWNYLLAAGIAAAFFAQMGFLLGGGARLLRASHRVKQARNPGSCPALAMISNNPAARRIYLTDETGLQARSAGLLRPRILLTRELVETLPSRELDAVTAHEEAHCAGRDNLMLALAKPVAMSLFYLPGMRMAFKEMRCCLEKAADRKAASRAGGTLVVASALASIARQTAARTMAPQPEAASIGGQGEGELVSRLEDLISEPPARRRCWRLAVFGAGLAVAFTIFASSALAVVGSDSREAFTCFTQHEVNQQGDSCGFDHSRGS